jgi:DNA invertase Pin-like site-specific DNA recombinase
MKVGFARVSTVEQDLSIQLTQLNEYGCEKFFMVNTQVFRLKMMSS